MTPPTPTLTQRTPLRGWTLRAPITDCPLES